MKTLSILIMAVGMGHPDTGVPLVTNNCHECIEARPVPGNSHIECVTPDPGMRGDSHGIREGWFMYPLVFDPTWMTRECRRFKPAVSNAVSGAISDANVEN